MQLLLSTIVSSCVASLVAVFALYYASNHVQHSNGPHGDASSLSREGAFLFRSLDLDGDGFLSPQEVAPVIDKLAGKKADGEGPDLVESGEVIDVEAFFTPLQLDSLRGNLDSSLPFFLNDDKVSLGLRNWTVPSTTKQSFSIADFTCFLPSLKRIQVGLPWALYQPENKEYKNSRYFPPMPDQKVALLNQLLRMFHPRPFLETRFLPRGAVAVVRAQNDEYLDIAFRVHAEFQLNEPPAWPFWFTPAQFTGHVIMSRDGGRVEYFHLYVPAKRSLNVDMEWLTKDSELDMEVEIGYLPRMELESKGPSRHHNDIVWKEEISWEKVEVELEKALYPFKQVTYHPFESVFDKAAAEKKLIHNIVLWGALDDQSC